MKARELMTPNPECCTPDESVTHAAQLMRDLDVGIIPVVSDKDSMRLTGVITDRDIAIRHVADEHGKDCRVSEHMTGGGLCCVTPDADEREVMDAMERDQLRRIPVVEGDNRLVGIIAQADVATTLSEDKTGEVVERVSEPGEPNR